MRAMEGWTVSVLMILGLVIALHQLGLDVTSSLGPALRSIAHLLNQPLL